MTCRVLKLPRQPYYRRRAHPITDAKLLEAHRANALFDAYRHDPEFGYRYPLEEVRDAIMPMAERTAWRVSTSNRWWSVLERNAPRTPNPDPRCTMAAWSAASVCSPSEAPGSVHSLRPHDNRRALRLHVSRVRGDGALSSCNGRAGCERRGIRK